MSTITGVNKGDAHERYLCCVCRQKRAIYTSSFGEFPLCSIGCSDRFVQPQSIRISTPFVIYYRVAASATQLVLANQWNTIPHNEAVSISHHSGSD
jgi:hypothetical protein